MDTESGKRRLSGWRALVTGASSGIGAALAGQLAARGADLVLTARREDRLLALAHDLGERHEVDVRVVAADLADPASAKALFDRTEGEGVAIDLLVNNAGLGTWRSFLSTSWSTCETMLHVNVVSLTRLTHLFLPRMVERRRGHVMNVSSIGAFSPCPNYAVYAPTKTYVRNFTESLDAELTGTGVRALVVCPGGTTTEFIERAGQSLKSGSGKFMMTADEVARIAVDKMLAGRRTVVTGLLNALGMWLLRFVPRRFLPALARRSMAMAVHAPSP